ncbi:hypothetical protein SDJN03_00153, partial [Cucurbita argyrosperma subsp. sororia]
MSAVVCGTKRSFFEELPPSPPVSKRLRCSSTTSPIRFAASCLIDQLQNLFPQMDHQLLVRVLEECGNDLDAAIKSLSNMCLGSTVENPVATTAAETNLDQGLTLEALESSISARAGADAAQNFHKENMQLKEQIEVLLRENTILKRAVAIQHERQKEFEDKNLELQHLKQLVSQYQEQLRTLEVNNYALTMHLKQAQQSSSIPGRFHPDVF